MRQAAQKVEESETHPYINLVVAVVIQLRGFPTIGPLAAGLLSGTRTTPHRDHLRNDTHGNFFRRMRADGYADGGRHT